MEMEDDVFFADLSKQIASLITDDKEDDNAGEVLPTQYFPVPFQHRGKEKLAMNVQRSCKSISFSSPGYAYEFSFTRESRGTGVFIPKSSLARRKSKPGEPHTAATNYQANQFNRKVSAISQISSINEFNHNTSHSCYNKSGGVKKLNG